MNSNISKAIHEVVSVDAWHAAFDAEGRATVHVDLSFFIGEMGGEESSEVTFELALKRAILKVNIPPTEGLAVIQSSVDREPSLEGVKRVIDQTRIAKSGGAVINAQMRVPLAVSASGHISASASGERATSTEFSSNVSEFDTRQIIDSARNYGWEIKSTTGGVLNGKVWDPVRRPRLTVKKLYNSKVESGFQIQVFCRKSDLNIENVKLKSSAPF